ncbi:hypothetical protein PRIPAC_71387 [Pristionchus pacificus]|uniref:Uncharacterized protein n=1 Tax=Pristionchus pacificus TaxID=54126 RepID=A0A2A6CS54_PRIPA|nr:hypothetical protein PRIPAC_71387 [Pristionchus pacificus]|eukprot:PDM81044.1 hypothetical protein PRIPAC_36047 [Pristionchus pacificus]
MEGFGKDSRSKGNLKARRTVHHRSGTFNGPDVISKKQIGSQKTPFSSTTSDPFGVNDFNVAYSLNKQKRWEAVDRPADVMQKKLDVEKLSFISTSVPRTSGRFLPIDSIPLDMEDLNKYGGGVVRFVTCVNGEVTDRKSKKKAHFKSLLEQPGPGPQPRGKKQLREEEKNRKRIERSMKGISNENLNVTETEKIDPEIQYTAMTLYHQRSSEAESMWRKHQSVFRANAKKASARNRRLGENIYESDSDQDELEDEFKRKYWNVLDI